MAIRSQVESLISLLNEKLQLLERMLKYTREQSQAITEDDMDKLNNLIDKKSKLIEKVNIIDDKFEEAYVGLKSELGIESLGELRPGEIEGAEELKTCTGKILSVIELIKVTEEENRNKAKRLLNILEERIRKMNQGKKLRSAYSSPVQETPPYFMDKKK